MLKEYILATQRRVCVSKLDGKFSVTIKDLDSELKKIAMTGLRWATLMSAMTVIDESVDLLQSEQYVRLNTHFGGGFYVSVTTGFRCVDLRRFFYDNVKDELQPTREGIALTLSQWSSFKTIVQEINRDFPDLAETDRCIHVGMEDYFNCKECFPTNILPKPVL
jgi:Transcriptional Coactivator p15 (PC4)